MTENKRTLMDAPADLVTEQVDVQGTAWVSPSAGGSTQAPEVGGGGHGGTIENGAPDESGDPWPARATAKGMRLRIPTLMLVGLLVGAGAFWGGAAVQRSDGTTSASSALSNLAARFGAGGRTATGAAAGAGVPGGFGGATSTAAASGTVTVINGSTLYVTTSSGSIVKVTLSPAAKVTRNANASNSALTPGDTVVVQGTTSKNGTVDATSVAATAAGVPTTGGGGGFGGAGGAPVSSNGG